MKRGISRRLFLLGAAAAGVSPALAAEGNAQTGGAYESGGRLRIAHLTDPQFGFGTVEKGAEANYIADLARFERAIASVNALKPDLALITGDMTNRAEEVVRDWPRLLKRFTVPVAVAPGNHDMGNAMTRENRERYLSVFGWDYKAFDVKGWRVIVGNTQFWRKTELVDELARYEAWLKEELERAKGYGGRVLIAGHIPPFADAPGEKDSYENYPQAGRTQRMKAYLEAGAKFFLAGHTHRMIMHGWRDLTILNAETTSNNFDSRPYGFRLFDIAGECDYTYTFVRV